MTRERIEVSFSTFVKRFICSVQQGFDFPPVAESGVFCRELQAGLMQRREESGALLLRWEHACLPLGSAWMGWLLRLPLASRTYRSAPLRPKGPGFSGCTAVPHFPRGTSFKTFSRGSRESDDAQATHRMWRSSCRAQRRPVEGGALLKLLACKRRDLQCSPKPNERLR